MLELLKPGGFASAYGVPPKGIRYPPGWKPSNPQEFLCFGWVLDLIRRGWIKPDWFITHRWGFEGILDAFAQVRKGEVLKGIVYLSNI